MSKQHILPMYSHPSNILPRHTEFLANNQNHRKVKWFAWSHIRDPWLRRSPETQLSHCSVQWARGSQTSFPRYPLSASNLDSPSLTIYLPPLCPCLQMPPSLPRPAPAWMLEHKQEGGWGKLLHGAAHSYPELMGFNCLSLVWDKGSFCGLDENRQLCSPASENLH